MILVDKNLFEQNVNMNISVIKGQTVNFHGNGRKLRVTDVYGKSGFWITNQNYFTHGIHDSQICGRLRTTKNYCTRQRSRLREKQERGEIRLKYHSNQNFPPNSSKPTHLVHIACSSKSTYLVHFYSYFMRDKKDTT